MPMPELIEALHAFLDDGGDVDTMLDAARMVADERRDDDEDA